MGDLVSFMRLMALGLAGASIWFSLNQLLVSFLLLLASVLVLCIYRPSQYQYVPLLLSGYVHGARLISFVEFLENSTMVIEKPLNLETSRKYVRCKKSSAKLFELRQILYH